MNRLLAALAAALILAPPAFAAPAVVDVRVEGKTRTLFEGPIRTGGHDIRATSDPTIRRCDGTNNGAHPTPGPTATAAAVDAMAITGRAFDGKWYPGYDDFFVQQFGPDREDGNTYAYWGILVNRVFTPIGGCQFQLAADDQVLWVYDAFNGRPLLWLTGPAAVAVGAPLTVDVRRSSGAMDGAPTEEGPAGGVRVAPVVTDASGDQTVQAGGATTGSDGQATLSFPAAGWYRLKADAGGFVRSNRLDVCVGTCGPAPADTLVREAPVTPIPTPTPTATPTATPATTATPTPGPATAPPPPVAPPAPSLRLQAPHLAAGGARTGRTEVRWRVLAGQLRGWTIDAAPAGTTTWTRAASGTTEQSASLRLAAGRSYDLRFTATDALGRAGTSPIGRAVVPIDDRVVAKRGWTRVAGPAAWKGTLSRGSMGAAANVRLAAGRPLALLRGGTGRVQVGAKTFRVTKATRTLTGARRTKSGTVRLRVLSGRIELDGVAVAP